MLPISRLQETDLLTHAHTHTHLRRIPLVDWPLVTRSFSFAPFAGQPLPPLFSGPLGTFGPFFSTREMLCSVEQGPHHRPWRGAVSGWTSPESSGRNLLPETCVKTGHWAYVSVGLLGRREQGNLQKCSPSALERVLSETGRAPSRALSGALPRAPRFLRALSRALGEHFRRFPCSRLPSRPTDTQHWASMFQEVLSNFVQCEFLGPIYGMFSARMPEAFLDLVLYSRRSPTCEGLKGSRGVTSMATVKENQLPDVHLSLLCS